MKHPPPLPNLFRRGFTLVELLSVIAIIALLATVAIPVLNTGNNEMNQGLQVTAGMMDQARQYAISRNTYTWLVVGVPSAAQDLQVGIVASKDGTDVLSWSASTVDLSTSTVYELVGRIRTVPRISVADTPSVTIVSLPDSGGTTPSKMAQVDFSMGTGAQAKKFTKAVQFTPT